MAGLLAARKYLGLTPATEAKLQTLNQRYGAWALLLAWMPVIGDPLTVLAGATHPLVGICTPCVWRANRALPDHTSCLGRAARPKSAPGTLVSLRMVCIKVMAVPYAPVHIRAGAIHIAAVYRQFAREQMPADSRLQLVTKMIFPRPPSCRGDAPALCRRGVKVAATGYCASTLLAGCRFSIGPESWY